MSYLLGIDLGTTNSLGCVYKDGRIQLIPNRYGYYLTPSVVSVDENPPFFLILPADLLLSCTLPEVSLPPVCREAFRSTSDTWGFHGP